MPYNEFLAAREPVLNDEASTGEVAELYDFRNAKPGETVRLVAGYDVHELVKLEEATEDDDALEMWLHEGERVSIALLEPNKYGSSFRLPGAVLRAGMEVGVSYVERSVRETNVRRSLGKVAALAGSLGQETKELAGV